MAQTDALNNIQNTAVGYEFTGQETESLSWTNRVESNESVFNTVSAVSLI